MEPKITTLSNSRAATVAPAPRDYVLPGLTAGSVGILAGPGGSSKSLYALQAACAVACPHPGANPLKLYIKNHGPALFLTAEDDAEEVDRRFYHICQGMPASAAEALYDDDLLRRASLVDSAPDLLSRKWQREIEDAAQGCRLIVIDTLSCFAPGVEENSNTEMAKIVAVLKQLASYIGAAVLVLTHVNKSQSRDVNAVRGASAIVNGVRYAASMTPLLPEDAAKLADDGNLIGAERAKQYVRFTTVKRNYGLLGGDLWYRRKTDGGENGVGVLVPTAVAPAEKTTAKPATNAPDGYDELFGVAKGNVTLLARSQRGAK